MSHHTAFESRSMRLTQFPHVALIALNMLDTRLIIALSKNINFRNIYLIDFIEANFRTRFSERQKNNTQRNLVFAVAIAVDVLYRFRIFSKWQQTKCNASRPLSIANAWLFRRRIDISRYDVRPISHIFILFGMSLACFIFSFFHFGFHFHVKKTVFCLTRDCRSRRQSIYSMWMNVRTRYIYAPVILCNFIIAVHNNRTICSRAQLPSRRHVYYSVLFYYTINQHPNNETTISLYDFNFLTNISLLLLLLVFFSFCSIHLAHRCWCCAPNGKMSCTKNVSEPVLEMCSFIFPLLLFSFGARVDLHSSQRVGRIYYT